MTVSRVRLYFATEVFMSRIRRDFTRLYPNKENPVRPLAEYPEDQRAALMEAVQASINASSAGGDEAFKQWLQRTGPG